MTHFISLQTLDLISVTKDGKCKFQLSPSMSKDCDSIELTKTVLKMGTEQDDWYSINDKETTYIFSFIKNHIIFI